MLHNSVQSTSETDKPIWYWPESSLTIDHVDMSILVKIWANYQVIIHTSGPSLH